jgi:hypothetical protein
MAPSCGTSCFRSIVRIYFLWKTKRTHDETRLNFIFQTKSIKRKIHDILNEWQETKIRQYKSTMKRYLIKCVDWRREATMYTKNTIIDDSRQWEIVKDFTAISPNIHRPKFPQAFIIKSIDLSYLPWFMVATDQCDTIRVTDLVWINIDVALTTTYYYYY